MKRELREKRQRRGRARVSGDAKRPRASVFRSATRLVVQLIDDKKSKTLAAATGKTPEEVGKKIAEAAKEKRISSVVFDRGGYKYHGRVKRLADAMRENGLKF